MNVEKETCAIGLDVGGTKTAGGIVSFPSGRLLRKRTILTRPERDGLSVLADVVELAKSLLTEAGSCCSKIAGIGIGLAELVDPGGNVTSAQTIKWRGLPIQESVSKLAPAVVDADVRAAALGEALFGAGKPFKLFASVSVGTGIGYSLVLDGRPFAGARGNALILSSGPLTTFCAKCGAQSEFVLEEFASGPALVVRYNAAAKANFQRAEEVVAAAASDDTLAVEVVSTAAGALGSAVGFLVNILDPEAVVVGGGLGLSGALYWSSFLKSAREHIWSDTNRDLPILAAALGPDAGIIGAAARIWLKQCGDDPRA